MFSRPIAHRGLHDRANGVIENSRAAFAAAMARDFPIECDLQLSADGIAVVFHDPSLQRLTGLAGDVRDLPAAELGRTPLLGSAAGDCPQTFPEFLEQIGGRVLLQVELKHQEGAAGTETLAREAARALASYGGPVTVESFDPELIRLTKEFGFAGPRGIITYDYEERDSDASALTPDDRFILRNLLHWRESRFDFISCEQSALGLPAIAFWRALGVPVTAWTVRTPDQAVAARALADQIVFEGFDPDGG